MANLSHKVTEYFPVRRSVRKCKRDVLEKKQRDLENEVLCEVEDGLEVKHFVGKARGVITAHEFKKNEFVVDYVGDLIDQIEAKNREVEYGKDKNVGYISHFQHRNHQYCDDTTAETDKLGRLENQCTPSPTDDIVKKPLENGQINVKSNEKKVPSRIRGKVKNITSSKGSISDPNPKITEYFPVRRSIRKCKKTVLEEKQRDLENKVLCEVEDGLEVKHFLGKGRGIITTREFKKGEFVVEYAGDLIDQIEAKSREAEYAKDTNTGCYMYYFQHRNHQYCVDATAETDKLGRLVNHSRNGNLIARVVEVGSTPHLVLTAKEDIPIGVELTYDYGDRSRESIRNHPWLAL